MRIKKIRLKNGYKRFHDLTIDLGNDPARIVALVGPNGCGKSSVLDGLLYHARAHHQIGRNHFSNQSYHSMDDEAPSNWKNIEIVFTSGSYLEVKNRRAANKAGTIFSFRSSYRYNSQLKIAETKATDDIGLNNYGAGDASSLDAKMENNYRRLYAEYRKYMDDNDSRPSEAKAKIIGELNGSICSCLDLKVSNIGDVDNARGTLYFKKLDHPTDFEFDVLSSGEKEVVDLLLDLYLRKNDYDDTVFLIDEPELHISTSIQRKLLVEIDRLVGKNCQILLTTHSIGLLRALQTEMRGQCQIIQFPSEGNLASEPHTLEPVKMTPAIWRELFAIALDDLASLVSPKTLVYCEGRAEPNQQGGERGLDAKVFNNIFGATHPDTLFVSSGGNTELDQRSAIAIQILGKALPELDILVLKDRDMASGKEATVKDRKVYLGLNPENHRVLGRREIENYLYDKEVLKAYCVGEDLVFKEGAYDEFVKNISDQNLKDDTSRIKKCCSIKININPDRFKINLSTYIRDNMIVYCELKDCIFS